ncbi:MAG: hypothetical protein PHO86_02190 [Bacilli bacterium]|nr:hypothetical protein [Bacilli bacterium]
MNDSSNSNKTDLKILIDNKKNNRRTKIKLIFLIIVTSLILSFLLVYFALNWQQSYTKLAYCNAFYFSGFILFFIGWMILMANKNIMAPLTYGLKSFFLMFSTKKPKLDYYNYLKEREKHLFPKYIMLTPFFASIPNFIIAVILHVNLA